MPAIAAAAAEGSEVMVEQAVQKHQRVSSLLSNYELQVQRTGLSDARQQPVQSQPIPLLSTSQVKAP